MFDTQLMNDKMQLNSIWLHIGAYSICQACTFDWTGFQSLLVVFVVGTTKSTNAEQIYLSYIKIF